jgi:uncharacterized protein YjiS (DUF1127 family)
MHNRSPLSAVLSSQFIQAQENAASPAARIPKILQAALARRRARRALHQLDDRMLKDIGIARSDIDHILRPSQLTGPQSLGGYMDCE